MREPKRYDFIYNANWGDVEREEDLEGDYVNYADYARLKAEVERLTKAGDAVCESPYLWETDPAVIAWRAAKEGKQP